MRSMSGVTACASSSAIITTMAFTPGNGCAPSARATSAARENRLFLASVSASAGDDPASNFIFIERKSMKMHPRIVALLLMPMLLWPMAGLANDVKKKQEVVASIDKHQAELTALSDKIWAYAETALRETRSSKVLADYAEQQGFEVKRGVAGMPTAFVASYGQGRPIIGILGEFDALPGISQKAEPVKTPLQAGAAGPGCGHNPFRPAGLRPAPRLQQVVA